MNCSHKDYAFNKIYKKVKAEVPKFMVYDMVNNFCLSSHDEHFKIAASIIEDGKKIGLTLDDFIYVFQAYQKDQVIKTRNLIEITLSHKEKEN